MRLSRSSALRLPSPGRGRRRQTKNKDTKNKLTPHSNTHQKQPRCPPTKSHAHHPSHPPAKGSKPTDPLGGQHRSRTSGRKPTGPITRTARPQELRLVGKDPPTSQTPTIEPSTKKEPLTSRQAALSYKPRQKRQHADAYTNLITCIPLSTRSTSSFP